MHCEKNTDNSVPIFIFICGMPTENTNWERWGKTNDAILGGDFIRKTARQDISNMKTFSHLKNIILKNQRLGNLQKRPQSARLVTVFYYQSRVLLHFLYRNGDIPNEEKSGGKKIFHIYYQIQCSKGSITNDSIKQWDKNLGIQTFTQLHMNKSAGAQSNRTANNHEFNTSNCES